MQVFKCIYLHTVPSLPTHGLCMLFTKLHWQWEDSKNDKSKIGISFSSVNIMLILYFIAEQLDPSAALLNSSTTCELQKLIIWINSTHTLTLDSCETPERQIAPECFYIIEVLNLNYKISGSSSLTMLQISKEYFILYWHDSWKNL